MIEIGNIEIHHEPPAADRAVQAHRVFKDIGRNNRERSKALAGVFDLILGSWLIDKVFHELAVFVELQKRLQQLPLSPLVRGCLCAQSARRIVEAERINRRGVAWIGTDKGL